MPLSSRLVDLKQPRLGPGGEEWEELFVVIDREAAVVQEADGRPGVAFFGRAGGFPFALGWSQSAWINGKDVERDHPNERAFERAMSLCCDRYSCANGRRIHKGGQYEKTQMELDEARPLKRFAIPATLVIEARSLTEARKMTRALKKDLIEFGYVDKAYLEDPGVMP